MVVHINIIIILIKLNTFTQHPNLYWSWLHWFTHVLVLSKPYILCGYSIVVPTKCYPCNRGIIYTLHNNINGLTEYIICNNHVASRQSLTARKYTIGSIFSSQNNKSYEIKSTKFNHSSLKRHHLSFDIFVGLRLIGLNSSLYCHWCCCGCTTAYKVKEIVVQQSYRLASEYI